jgi:Fur family transcriptional regulator, ferric uptake regulator
MTKTRKAVLDILMLQQEPSTAQQLYTHMQSSCDQVTVYRTLRYLEEAGFAESFVLHCSEHGTERYYCVSGTDKHRHWFHCESCHCFIDMGNCQLEKMVRQYEADHSLKILNHTLYFTGLCTDCAKSAESTQ